MADTLTTQVAERTRITATTSPSPAPLSQPVLPWSTRDQTIFTQATEIARTVRSEARGRTSAARGASGPVGGASSAVGDRTSDRARALSSLEPAARDLLRWADLHATASLHAGGLRAGAARRLRSLVAGAVAGGAGGGRAGAGWTSGIPEATAAVAGTSWRTPARSAERGLSRGRSGSLARQDGPLSAELVMTGLRICCSRAGQLVRLCPDSFVRIPATRTDNTPPLGGCPSGCPAGKEHGG